DVLEEDLVELLAARHLAERAHGHAGRLHVADEVADALRLRRRRIRPGEEDPPARELRVARPHLLPADDPAVAMADGARPERGQVGACPGLREELAPELLGGQDLRQEAALLLLGAVRDERRSDQVDADPVDDLRRARRGDLLLEDVVLDDGRAAPAVLARPVDADPSPGVQLPLPVTEERDLVGERPGRTVGVGPPARRKIRREPGAYLGAERLLGGAEGQVHSAVLARGDAGASIAGWPRHRT